MSKLNKIINLRAVKPQDSRASLHVCNKVTSGYALSCKETIIDFSKLLYKWYHVSLDLRLARYKYLKLLPSVYIILHLSGNLQYMREFIVCPCNIRVKIWRIYINIALLVLVFTVMTHILLNLTLIHYTRESCLHF